MALSNYLTSTPLQNALTGMSQTTPTTSGANLSTTGGINPTPVQSLPLVNPNQNYFQQTPLQNAMSSLSTPTQQTKATQTYTTPSGTVVDAQGNMVSNPNDVSAKYKTGFQTAQQTGMPAPGTSAQAAMAVNSITGGQTPPPQSNPIDLMLAEDEGYQKLVADYRKYNDSVSQRTSLLDEYKALQNEAGLPKLNEELINYRNVIEGTEDDIRAEITKAGGFATESQVLALTNARNKGLIKNYNRLLDTVNAAKENINMMMQFSQADRDYADQQFRTQLEFDKQIVEYRDKMRTNAQNAYNRIIENVGYAGLYQATKGDPYQVSLVEKTLGLAPGSLSQLATYKAPLSEKDQLDLELKRSQLETDKYQRMNIISQINERNSPTDTIGGVPAKVMKDVQSSAEYKTINGVIPALSAVKTYLDAVKNTGSFEWWNGDKAGTLKSSYGNAIAAWKSLASLGALSGADFGLAENVIPEPSLFTRDSKVKSQLNSALQNGIKQAEIMTNRLSQNYPDAAQLLNRQLDDLYVIAYPDKYTVGADGNVYEITN